MEQLVDDPRIMGVGRRRLKAAVKTECVVDGDMYLHPESPMLALTGLMNLRIALALLIFGRSGGVDDAGIDGCRYDRRIAIKSEHTWSGLLNDQS